MYSECMMKRETLEFKLGRPKTRAHKVLFGDTPFRPKVIASKLQYTRKAKHPNKLCNS